MRVVECGRYKPADGRRPSGLSWHRKKADNLRLAGTSRVQHAASAHPTFRRLRLNHLVDPLAIAWQTVRNRQRAAGHCARVGRSDKLLGGALAQACCYTPCTSRFWKGSLPILVLTDVPALPPRTLLLRRPSRATLAPLPRTQTLGRLRHLAHRLWDFGAVQDVELAPPQ